MICINFKRRMIMNIHSLFNVVLLLYLVSFPILIEMNKRVLKGKNKDFNKALKSGRKIHPYTGIILIISAAIHGYLKLGGKLMFHTGSLLLLMLVVTGIVGFIYKKKRIKRFALTHRTIGIIIVLLFLLHYFNPWFFS